MSCLLEKKITTSPSVKSVKKPSNKNMTSLYYIEQILDLVGGLNYKAIEDMLLFDFKRYSKEELVKLYSLPNLKSILKDLKQHIGEYEETEETEDNVLHLKAVMINEILDLREAISIQVIQDHGYEKFFKLSENEIIAKYSAEQLEILLKNVKSTIINEIFKLKNHTSNQLIQDHEYESFLKQSKSEIMIQYSVKDLEDIFSNIMATTINETSKLQENDNNQFILDHKCKDPFKLPENKFNATHSIKPVEDLFINTTKVTLINEILELRESISIQVIQNLEYEDFLKLSKNELISKYSAEQIEGLLRKVKSAIINEIFKLKEECNIQRIQNFEYRELLKSPEKILVTEYSVKQLEDVLRSIKGIMVDKILELQKDISIYAMQNLGYEDFLKLSKDELYTKYSIDEIKDVLSNLKDPGVIEDALEELIDPLLIIKKYKSGIDKETKENQKLVTENQLELNIWREHVPEVIRKNMKTWKITGIQEMYDFCAEYVNKLGGSDRTKVWNFYCDLSEIIFSAESQKEEDHSESDFPQDEMADSIMSLVEMIILPHREVLDRINEKKGNVLFSNIWNEPFNAGLKKEVKDRDNWKCVICESEQNLHVHHKIPRSLGGVNHKDNLVTLCGSCHPAIETADVNHAFAKCFSNFKKNKYKERMRPDHLKKDKSLLKEEVENELDRLLLTLLNRNEKELTNKLTETMNKLEVIFYD